MQPDSEDLSPDLQASERIQDMLRQAVEVALKEFKEAPASDRLVVAERLKAAVLALNSFLVEGQGAAFER
jgi:hypothetical protein